MRSCRSRWPASRPPGSAPSFREMPLKTQPNCQRTNQRANDLLQAATRRCQIDRGRILSCLPGVGQPLWAAITAPKGRPTSKRTREPVPCLFAGDFRSALFGTTTSQRETRIYQSAVSLSKVKRDSGKIFSCFSEPPISQGLEKANRDFSSHNPKRIIPVPPPRSTRSKKIFPPHRPAVRKFRNTP